jgi:two-component system, OmpR family, sensor histidine kinase BasS
MSQRASGGSWLGRQGLKTRLIWLLASILLLTHCASSYWLWHESREQVAQLVHMALEPGHSHHELEKEQRETIAALFVPPLVFGGLGLVLAYLAISWLSRPMERLQGLLQQRSSSNLEPLKIDGLMPELRDVVEAMNGVLSRLSLALQRERQFSADVAHELRTPLAGIRLNLELMQHAGVQSAGPLIERLDSLHHTVEQLLSMARVERNLIIGVAGELEFASEVFAPLEAECRQMLARRELTLKAEIDAIHVQGEVSLLQMLLRNLVENASRYADIGSEVSLSFRRLELPEGTFAELLLSDSGPGVNPAKLARLTDAFLRLDSRGNGVGLGLNIVARICALHQATLSFENVEQPRGFQVRVRFRL